MKIFLFIIFYIIFFLFKKLIDRCSSPASQPIGPDPIKGQGGAVAKSGAGKRKDFPTLTFLDWLSCFAISVNEENACGGKRLLVLLFLGNDFNLCFFFISFSPFKGRVVTAPTNGAAGSMILFFLFFFFFSF